MPTVVAIALVTTLTGCWPQVGAGPENTRFNPAETTLTVDSVGSLVVAWEVASNATFSEPIVVGDRVVSVRTHRPGPQLVDELVVESRDVATGELRWERSLIPEGFAGNADAQPVVHLDGALWVAYRHSGMAACRGVVERLDPATGGVLSSEVTGTLLSPVVADSRWATSIAAHCDGPTVAGYDLVVRDVRTREVAWSHTFPGLPGPPTIAGGRVFLVTTGSVHAYTLAGCGLPTCGPLWVQPPATGFYDGRPVATPDGRVVVPTRTPGSRPIFEFAGYHVLLASTGDVVGGISPVPSSDSSYLNGLAVAHGVVYASTFADVLSAGRGSLTAQAVGGCGTSCPAPWQLPFTTFDRQAAPVVGGDVAYVSDGQQLLALAAAGCGAAQCTPLASVDLSGVTALSVAGGRVFATTARPERALVALASAG